MEYNLYGCLTTLDYVVPVYTQNREGNRTEKRAKYKSQLLQSCLSSKFSKKPASSRASMHTLIL